MIDTKGSNHIARGPLEAPTAVAAPTPATPAHQAAQGGSLPSERLAITRAELTTTSAIASEQAARASRNLRPAPAALPGRESEPPLPVVTDELRQSVLATLEDYSVKLEGEARAWVLGSLQSLAKRLARGENTGLRVPRRGESHDYDKHDMDPHVLSAILAQAEEPIFIAPSQVDRWLRGQLYPVTPAQRDAVRAARDLGEISRLMNDVLKWPHIKDAQNGTLTFYRPGWEYVEPLHGSLVSFPFDASKPLAEQPVSEQDAAAVSDAMQRVRSHVCLAAVPGFVAQMDHVGELYDLVNDYLGWPSRYDARAKVRTYTVPENGAEISHAELGLGSSWEKLTDDDRHALAAAIRDGDRFATKGAEVGLARVGVADANELARLAGERYLPQINSLLTSTLGWNDISRPGATNSTFENPRFKNRITIDRNEGPYARKLSDDEAQAIVQAVRDHTSYVTEPARPKPV